MVGVVGGLYKKQRLFQQHSCSHLEQYPLQEHLHPPLLDEQIYYLPFL